MILPPCFNYNACLAFGLDYRVTIALSTIMLALLIFLGFGIERFLKESNSNHSTSKCNNCGNNLNGLAWCGNKSCIEFWRETEKKTL